MHAWFEETMQSLVLVEGLCSKVKNQADHSEGLAVSQRRTPLGGLVAAYVAPTGSTSSRDLSTDKI